MINFNKFEEFWFWHLDHLYFFVIIFILFLALFSVNINATTEGRYLV